MLSAGCWFRYIASVVGFPAYLTAAASIVNMSASSKKVLTRKKKHAGVHCMAPGCANVYYSKPGVSYHRLPSKGSRVTEWLQAMKRKDWPNIQYARVCSDHFTDEDYMYKTVKSDDGTLKQIKTSKLTEKACPSRFDFSSYNVNCTDISTTTVNVDSDRQVRYKRRAQSKVIIVLYVN